MLYGRSRKGLTVPYQSFADALSRWTASASDDDLGGIVNRWGSYLSGLLPDLVTRFGVKPLPPVSEPGLHRLHQLQGLSALLSAVASTAPVAPRARRHAMGRCLERATTERAHPQW